MVMSLILWVLTDWATKAPSRHQATRRDDVHGSTSVTKDMDVVSDCGELGPCPGKVEVEQRMDLNMEVLISRSPGMGVSDSVAEDARAESCAGATTELPNGRSGARNFNIQYPHQLNILFLGGLNQVLAPLPTASKNDAGFRRYNSTALSLRLSFWKRIIIPSLPKDCISLTSKIRAIGTICSRSVISGINIRLNGKTGLITR